MGRRSDKNYMWGLKDKGFHQAPSSQKCHQSLPINHTWFVFSDVASREGLVSWETQILLLLRRFCALLPEQTGKGEQTVSKSTPGGVLLHFDLLPDGPSPPHSIYLCQSCPKANQSQQSIKSKLVTKPQMKSLRTASELLIICSPSTCCICRKCFLNIPMNLFYYLQVGSVR